jgi:hypothetical protein
MRPRSLALFASIAVLLALVATDSTAQPRRVVTVQELIELNHRLEIDVGTEVVWGDPHFERVWFPSGSGVSVKRTEAGFSAVFDSPGRYRGRFTIVGGHRANDVYPMTVDVRPVAR